MFEFEKEITAFTQVMREKLQENQHKTHWKEYFSSDCYLIFDRLREEVQELAEAIEERLSRKEVARECADIANFAMMIADVYGSLDDNH